MFSNRTLWVLQVVLGVYFVFVGVSHFVVPDGLPEMMSWMYELSDTLHVLSGTAEVLGGLGLLLPGLTRIMPQLTVYAAAGLVLVMVGAAIWHLTTGTSTASIGSNVVLGALCAWVAYGRAVRTPFPGTFDARAA
jgi:uncharacterized membrane protein